MHVYKCDRSCNYKHFSSENPKKSTAAVAAVNNKTEFIHYSYSEFIYHEFDLYL